MRYFWSAIRTTLGRGLLPCPCTRCLQAWNIRTRTLVTLSLRCSVTPLTHSITPLLCAPCPSSRSASLNSSVPALLCHFGACHTCIVDLACYAAFALWHLAHLQDCGSSAFSTMDCCLNCRHSAWQKSNRCTLTENTPHQWRLLGTMNTKSSTAIPAAAGSGMRRNSFASGTSDSMSQQSNELRMRAWARENANP